MIAAPEVPDPPSLKSLDFTPVTFSLNVTVQRTLAAFVVAEPSRLIAVTVGAVVSAAAEVVVVTAVFCGLCQALPSVPATVYWY